jgi:Kef-type K+ transport system membrane component KefB
MIDLTALSVFYELTTLLAVAAVIGLLCRLLHQPLLVGFIATGIVVGPIGLGIAATGEHVVLLSELGVTLLLFLVGLKLDLHLVRTLGGVALMTGLGQIVFTTLFGFLICLALGQVPLTALYVAIALTFSSTIIIVKLLSDKREIGDLHGRIALGFLIVQDLAVVLALIVLSGIGIGTGGTALATQFGLLGLGAGVLAVLVTLAVLVVAEPLVQRLAPAPELLVIVAVAWAALLTAIADATGLGKELGALLAGAALASTSHREAVVSRLASLRDFLLLFFFVLLGAGIELNGVGEALVSAIVLSLFVLIGNPLIVLVIMGLMGYRRRTGFLAGLTVAQISEFSLVFMGAGVALGHVDGQALGLVTLVGLITIALSTYMILYSATLYAWLEPFLAPFERRTPFAELEPAARAREERAEVVLIGLGRYGQALAETLLRHDVRLLAVDLDPQIVAGWRRDGRAARLGDVLDPDLAASLPLAHARLVIDAVPYHGSGVVHADHRLALLRALRQAGYLGRVAARSDDDQEVRRLAAGGIDPVLRPFHDAAEHAVDALLELVAPGGARRAGTAAPRPDLARAATAGEI